MIDLTKYVNEKLDGRKSYRVKVIINDYVSYTLTLKVKQMKKVNIVGEIKSVYVMSEREFYNGLLLSYGV